jgi:molybdopterin molybdotransferase
MRAGSADDCEIESGTAVKILTGARVPKSVEAVVMLEYCTETDDQVLVSCSVASGENIRPSGQEFKAGNLVLPAGIRANPPVIGLLASLGYASYKVHDRPRIAIVTTGDELVKPGDKLAGGEIYDSNSYALRAAVNALGIKDCTFRHAEDTRKATRRAFVKAFEEADIIISSGGVSVGDHDYVKEVMEDMKVQTIFWRVAVKPGKPIYFGILPAKIPKLIFGLPGNPVSSLVTFHQFVKPAILRCMGLTTPQFSTCTAKLTTDVRKKAGRLDFVRGTLQCHDDELVVAPTVGQDSHMLSGLSTANCLIHFDADAELLKVGSSVKIDLIDW